MAGGMLSVAVADGAASPPPRSEAIPAPAPAARTATRRISPAAPAATLLPRLAGAASRPIVTPGRGGGWRAGRGEGAGRSLPTGDQMAASGAGAGGARGGGDRDAAICEDAAGVVLAPGVGKLKRTQFGCPAAAARRA